MYEQSVCVSEPDPGLSQSFVAFEHKAGFASFGFRLLRELVTRGGADSCGPARSSFPAGPAGELRVEAIEIG
jgi:hypothetical protein